MKKYQPLTLMILLLAVLSLAAQKEQAVLPSAKMNDVICPPAECPCEDGIVILEFYYFGPDPVTISAYADQAQTTLIDSWAGVTDGAMLTLDGSALTNGRLPFYTFFEITSGGESCRKRVFTTCPINSWPGAREDLVILGEKIGNFIISGYTDFAGNPSCTIGDTEQDWRVGGNIVEDGANTLGTLNDENMVLITNNTSRGILTNTGELGINTQTPTATIDVNGTAHISGDTDIDGNTDIDLDLTVHGNAQIDGNADVDLDLTVDQNATVHGNAQIDGNADVDLDLTVDQNATVHGNGVIDGTLGVGTATPARKVHVAGDGIRLSSSATRFLDFRTDGTGLDINSVGDNLFLRSLAGNHVYMNSQPGDGKVAIGTTNTPNAVPGANISHYNLYVAGGILTDELRVRTGWADYVFLPEYQLSPLSGVKQQIARTGHLPGMPSQAEVEAGGLEVGDMFVRQQVKIEEIFLHLIEMDEELKALRAENAELRNLLEEARQ